MKTMFIILSLQNGDIRIIGTLIATNIAQEGSGFPVLHPAVFQYMCTGKYTDLPIENDDVPDRELKCLLQLVSCPYYFLSFIAVIMYYVDIQY